MLSDDTNLRCPKSRRNHCGALWVGSLDQRVSVRKSMAFAAAKWPAFCSLEAAALATEIGCSVHDASASRAEPTVSSVVSLETAQAGAKAKTKTSESAA